MIEHAYIHIPFCIRKCNYCSFVSGEDIKKKQQYLNALFFEIKKRYKGETLKTIYIGGGTPSLLDVNDIKQILSCFKYNKDVEITLEANPETVTEDKIYGLKEIGINRISLGVQTFNNDMLKCIGRKHTKEDILKAVNTIKKAGFSNINIDLIYGLPNQTIEMFADDVEQAVRLNVRHISSYGLKIEEGSFFFCNMPNNLPDDELQANMYLKLCEILRNNGFKHYEISNFSEQGFESKHNNAYWENKEYYGFGLNASGYEKNIRYRNLCDINEYIKNPLLKAEENILKEQEIVENEIFLALRLAKGLDVTNFNKKYNIDFISKYKDILNKYSSLNLLEYSESNVKLTEKGFLLSNEIMSEFIS